MRIGMLCLLIAAALLLAACGCTLPQAPANATPPTATAAATIKTVKTTPATPLPTAAVTAYPTPEPVSDNTVRITKDGFVPSAITITKGYQVRWVNDDESIHRIKFADAHFSMFLLSPSQSFSQRFNNAGVYDYSCMVKPYLQGTVRVQ